VEGRSSKIYTKAPPMRSLRRFWEQYLGYIFRGKELLFEFEMVKENSPPIRQFSDAWDCGISTKRFVKFVYFVVSIPLRQTIPPGGNI